MAGCNKRIIPFEPIISDQMQAKLKIEATFPLVAIVQYIMLDFFFMSMSKVVNGSKNNDPYFHNFWNPSALVKSAVVLHLKLDTQ